jgi:chemotaxis protein MotB
MLARRRRKVMQEPEHQDRWLVSYADFITLLFAFFVVMYSISSVNKDKYATFSESIDQAMFHTDYELKSIEPIQILDIPTTIQPIELPNLVVVTPEEKAISQEVMDEKQRLEEVSQRFKSALQPYVDSQLVGIKKYDFWLELEMNSELLFASGKAELSPKAQSVLADVAAVVRDLPNSINIEGYTDDVPIATGVFPSNWDLSSARATSVVKELVKNSIPPQRLSAVGYGEFHPIADNKEEAGRFKNRRVVLMVMSQVIARYGMSDEERAKALNMPVSELPTLPNLQKTPDMPAAL